MLTTPLTPFPQEINNSLGLGIYQTLRMLYVYFRLTILVLSISYTKWLHFKWRFYTQQNLFIRLLNRLINKRSRIIDLIK